MLNIDTHILVFLLQGELTEREHDLIATEQLAISDIVLWELAKLIQLGRISLDLNDPAFQTCLNSMVIFPISRDIAITSTQLDFKSDPADELIAATSIVEGIPLLTRDQKILKSKVIPFA